MRRKNSIRVTKPVDWLSHWIWVRANFGHMTTNEQSNSFNRPFPSNVEIGRRMREARKKRGWTIAQMAQIGELKAVVIGSYERGSRNMPISRLGEIAKILGVDVDFLLGQPTVRHDVVTSLTIDLRALSRPSYTHPSWLAVLITYCAGIVKKRNDWNGEVLSLRDSDALYLSFSLGVEQAELMNWLMREKYLITGINRS